MSLPLPGMPQLPGMQSMPVGGVDMQNMLLMQMQMQMMQQTIQQQQQQLQQQQQQPQQQQQQSPAPSASTEQTQLIQDYMDVITYSPPVESHIPELDSLPSANVRSFCTEQNFSAEMTKITSAFVCACGESIALRKVRDAVLRVAPPSLPPSAQVPSGLLPSATPITNPAAPDMDPLRPQLTQGTAATQNIQQLLHQFQNQLFPLPTASTVGSVPAPLMAAPPISVPVPGTAVGTGVPPLVVPTAMPIAVGKPLGVASDALDDPPELDTVRPIPIRVAGKLSQREANMCNEAIDRFITHVAVRLSLVLDSHGVGVWGFVPIRELEKHVLRSDDNDMRGIIAGKGQTEFKKLHPTVPHTDEALIAYGLRRYLSESASRYLVENDVVRIRRLAMNIRVTPVADDPGDESTSLLHGRYTLSRGGLYYSKEFGAGDGLPDIRIFRSNGIWAIGDDMEKDLDGCFAKQNMSRCWAPYDTTSWTLQDRPGKICISPEDCMRLDDPSDWHHPQAAAALEYPSTAPLDGLTKKEMSRFKHVCVGKCSPEYREVLKDVSEGERPSTPDFQGDVPHEEWVQRMQEWRTELRRMANSSGAEMKFEDDEVLLFDEDEEEDVVPTG
eukprot:Hpha_TRINITY_DN15763_c5_g3::TRINITY_DN15763_c5_g3_i3::g.37031::m.37031